MGRECGLRVRVLDVPAMQRLGMGGILAVGGGSARPPRMIAMEYTPKAAGRGASRKKTTAKKKGGGAQAPFCIVGKGITFDSGGISIKPAAGMEEMKHDMSGAAAVIGALRACALLELPHPVVGVIGAAENLPSGTAYRPGDIVSELNRRIAAHHDFNRVSMLCVGVDARRGVIGIANAGHPALVLYSAARRRIEGDRAQTIRLYAVESTPTNTGTKADHRLPLRASLIETFAHAVAGRLGVAGAASGELPEAASRWLDPLVRDLQSARGRCLVIPGDGQPASVHAVAHAMNAALGNVGSTVVYTQPAEAQPIDQLASRGRGKKELPPRAAAWSLFRRRHAASHPRAQATRPASPGTGRESPPRHRSGLRLPRQPARSRRTAH